MDVLLDQTYNFAIITPVKNYSNIRNRVISTNTFSSDIDEITDIESLPLLAKSSEDKIKSIFIRYTPHGKKEKKIKYFYNKNNIVEKMELFTASEKKKNFYTTKDRQIKKYFGDPFCRIEIKTAKRLIYKDDNKLIIKILHIHKYRSINWKFFRESKTSTSISFNLKTGNFIIIDDNGIKKKHGGKGLRFRTNNFERLRRLIRSKTEFLLRNVNIIDEKSRLEFIEAFDDQKFISIINNELLGNQLPICYVHHIDNESTDIMFDLLVKDFIKKRGIKVPNDYKEMLIHFFPLQKVLKKNDNKLVQAILDMFDVKCKGTVKYIHENPKINISSFIDTCHLFGEDYYHYIPKIVPKYFIGATGHIGDKYSVGLIIHYNMDKEEKDNMLHVINSYMAGRKFSNSLDIILKDHFDMIVKVRQYEPDLKFKYRTYNEFSLEHTRLSTLLSKIKKGWTIEYQFEEKLLKDVEAEMNAIKDEFSLITFKPYILKRDEDYIEEGSYMHHCVASYSNKDKSIIISLRTPDDIDRVTCEFDIQSGRCIQSRYFTNKNPPDYFLDGIALLKEKVHKFARWGLLNWREKKKVPIKINGIEVVIENPVPRTFQDVLLDDPFFNNNFENL